MRTTDRGSEQFVWVLASTADDRVPVILERPENYPFSEGERALYRVATSEEYQRYILHYEGDIA